MAVNIRLAIRPRPLVGGERVLLRLLLIADSVPQLREAKMVTIFHVRETLGLISSGGQSTKMEVGDGQPHFRILTGLPNLARHLYGHTETICRQRSLSAI